MSLERAMRVVSAEADDTEFDEAVPLARCLRVAITTSDLQQVDEHFGSASRIATYELSAAAVRFVGVAEFTDVQQDGNENKLIAKLEALAGHHAVVSTAIGASAVRQLIAHGVQPIKIGDATRVDEVLAYLQKAIEHHDTPWIEKALSAGQEPSSDRVAAMLDDDWCE